jgi:hypothetical protein
MWQFLWVNFCTFCTTKGTVKVIRGKFFVGLFFTEKVHRQLPQTIHRRAVHR